MQPKIITYNEKEKEKEKLTQHQLFNHLVRILKPGEQTKLIWNLGAGWTRPIVLGYSQDVFFKQSANVLVRKIPNGLRLNWCDKKWNILTYSEIHKKNAFWHLFISAKKPEINKVKKIVDGRTKKNTLKQKQIELFSVLYDELKIGQQKMSPLLNFVNNQPRLLGIRFNYLVNVFENKELIKTLLIRTKNGFEIKWLDEQNKERAADEVVFDIDSKTWQVLAHKDVYQKQKEIFDKYYQKKMKIGQEKPVPELKLKTIRPELLGVRRNLKASFTDPTEIMVVLERIKNGFIVKWCDTKGAEKARDEICYKNRKWKVRTTDNSAKYQEQDRLLQKRFAQMRIGQEENIETLVFKTNRPRLLNTPLDFLSSIFSPGEVLRIKLLRIERGFLVKWCDEQWKERAQHELFLENGNWKIVRPKSIKFISKQGKN